MTKIGNEYLTPYQNNYNRWVQYQTYDVTEQVKDGENCESFWEMAGMADVLALAHMRKKRLFWKR